MVVAEKELLSNDGRANRRATDRADAAIGVLGHVLAAAIARSEAPSWLWIGRFVNGGDAAARTKQIAPPHGFTTLGRNGRLAFSALSAALHALSAATNVQPKNEAE